jgi:hypothetical protein
MTPDRQELIELLRHLVASSDANDGEALMNCIENARELLEREDEGAAA